MLLTVITLFVLEYKKVSGGLLAPELTIAEYNRLVGELDRTVRAKGVRDAFQKLRDLIAKKPEVLNACHSLAHSIGHSAYKLSSNINTLWGFSDPLCGYGYIHGVLEYYVGRGKNPVNMASLACEYWKGKDTYSNCVHGSGHAFVLYLNYKDLEKALSWCEKYSGKDKFICAAGVFEESFEPHTGGIAESKFSHNAKDPNAKVYTSELFSQCKSIKSEYKYLCYTYIPYLFSYYYPAKYDELLKWCDRSEDGFQASCFYGAGQLIAKQNLSMPDLVDKFCKKTPEKFRKSCKMGGEAIRSYLLRKTKWDELFYYAQKQAKKFKIKEKDVENIVAKYRAKSNF